MVASSHVTNFDLTDIFTLSFAYIYADTILKDHFGVVAIQKNLSDKKRGIVNGSFDTKTIFFSQRNEKGE